ncbi:MAG: TonB-dependent receptor [Ferruginibacter sp.]
MNELYKAGCSFFFLVRNKKYHFAIIILTMLFSVSASYSYSQDIIQGKVVDEKTSQPLEAATVTLLPLKTAVTTNALGNFIFKKVKPADQYSIVISSIGYETKLIPLESLQSSADVVRLSPQQIELKAVNVSSQNGEQYKPISKTDIAMRGVNNSQEILRIIPGIVIGQHQGGGKAEQIFLRGFDADHGTDFRLDVDGIPINMVSHAHGQGFADSHFIIPETIDYVDFKKGPYMASKGDFATTGFVDFTTKNSLKENVVKIEGGQFNTYRLMSMFNLLDKKTKQREQNWYVATEYRYADAYFDHPQYFNRFNLFTKYNGKIAPRSYVTLSASTFWSKWNASGQIPGRAVDKGIVNFFGAIDPHEGGVTSRTNINFQLRTSFSNGDILLNQVFYSNSHFDLSSNFTFYLEDSVNGDEIRQKEARNLLGYNGAYTHISYLGNTRLTTEVGLQLRNDMIMNSELSHTKDRFTFLHGIKLGDINQLSVSPYVSETFKVSERFSINAGLRFDQFFYKYKNKLEADSTLPGIGIYKTKANTFSPKLNLAYHLNNSFQFYLTTGRGYHSNDARSAVAENGYLSLPAAYSADLGTVFKPTKNIIINIASWYIYLRQEFVYSGDGGFVEFNGKTRRLVLIFLVGMHPLSLSILTLT